MSLQQFKVDETSFDFLISFTEMFVQDLAHCIAMKLAVNIIVIVFGNHSLIMLYHLNQVRSQEFAFGGGGLFWKLEKTVLTQILMDL